MSSDRARPLSQLPKPTRSASEAIRRVSTAAQNLANAPGPEARGPGAELIARELGALRDDIGAWTAGIDDLDDALRTPYRLLVVGPSQAGKSTLVNVVAGHRVLPTTGGGDAKTLKETVLSYSPQGERILSVHYISAKTANERRFSLETFARSRPESAEWFVTRGTDHDAIGAELEDRAEVDRADDLAQSDDAEVAQDLRRRYEGLVLQIKTLIYPEVRDPSERERLPDEHLKCLEEATVADWVDGWRLLLGQRMVAGGRFEDLWESRLEPVRPLLGTEAVFLESDCDTKEFRAIVERHTAGHLAFLVDRVELALPATELEHMDVEDLPGVGNYRDPASDVAREVLVDAMKHRDLDGLLVVTSQSGLDQNTATLIEEAAVLRRVLEGETDLALAITHIDAMAKAEGQRLDDEGVDDDEFPSDDVLLEDARAKASQRQLEKLTSLLQQQTLEMEEGDRAETIGAVLSRTAIVGVEASAAEAFRFDLSRGIKRAFASSLEATGVPRLIAHFTTRAEYRHRERLARVEEQIERIRTSVDTSLQRIMRENDVARAVEIAQAARERYLADLDTRRIKLSNTWATQRADSQAALAHAIPAKVNETELAAHKAASRKQRLVIQRCRTDGRGGGMIHWATMKAALRRGGTWTGAHHLDLPGDLAGALMRPFLKGWREITESVEELLQRYRALAEAFLKTLSGEATDAARSSGVDVDGSAFEEARLQLHTNLESALAIVAASVDQLNQLVPSRLRSVLNDHFEAECERVLEENPHDGRPHFTRRLLEGYEEVGAEAVEKAVRTGTKVLRSALEKLSTAITKTLFDADPVSFAYRRLVAGVHDATEPAEVVAARAALVEWARSHADWARTSGV